MKDQLHLAAQYLAAAGISFVPKKEDDSHTNLGFDVHTVSLKTHQLSTKGDFLALNCKSFSLEFHTQPKTYSFPLNGKTHFEVLNWLQDTSNSILGKTYKYQLHYDLPYQISNDHSFKLGDVNILKQWCELRIIAQSALEQIINNNDLVAEIRIWPHHFDTGIFTELGNGSTISIGLGLAIPDQLSDTHYFYISAYRNGNIIDPSSFKNLEIGKWMSNGFKGAILPAIDLAESEAVTFFQEVIDHFNSKKNLI